MKKILLFILALFIVLVGILMFNTLTLKSKQLVTANGVPLQLPVDENAVQHLSGAIKINTVSYSDTLKMTEAKPRFDSFITFLKTTYPLVFTSMQDTVINSRNLLLKWQGANASLAPAVLYAHMDVVPVEQNTLAQWKH